MADAHAGQVLSTIKYVGACVCDFDLCFLVFYKGQVLSTIKCVRVLGLDLRLYLVAVFSCL